MYNNIKGSSDMINLNELTHDELRTQHEKHMKVIKQLKRLVHKEMSVIIDIRTLLQVPEPQKEVPYNVVTVDFNRSPRK